MLAYHTSVIKRSCIEWQKVEETGSSNSSMVVALVMVDAAVLIEADR